MLSQFKMYAYSDPYAPVLTGESGSLLDVLNACLVNGYGSSSYYKEPAGWTTPLPNSSSKGCYQQPSGSRLILFVNDNFPLTGSSTINACVCGCQVIHSYTGSSINHALPSASGYFPAYYQTHFTAQSTYNPNATRPPQGTIIWKKSTSTSTAVEIPWILFADAWTMYLFVQHGSDVASAWALYQFGDIFSISRKVDPYKCVIGGRTNGGSNASGYYDWTDMMVYQDFPSNHGLFAAKSWGGFGGPVMVNRMGNLANTINHAGYISTDAGTYFMVYPFYGYLNSGNGPDQSLYVNPVLCGEPQTNCVRGRFRGMFHLSHPSTNFGTGELIHGSNEYSGKTFMFIGQGVHTGHWLVEISPTVETNELP